MDHYRELKIRCDQGFGHLHFCIHLQTIIILTGATSGVEPLCIRKVCGAFLDAPPRVADGSKLSDNMRVIIVLV